MADPWDLWVPGVLNKRQMKELLDGKFLTFSGSRPKLDHSSIDLSLSDEAYEMIKGSVKPEDPPYDEFITTKTKLAKKHHPSPDGSYKLDSKKTYVFKLQERFEKRFREARLFYGQATAKSTVGRVDVLARLIVDGMRTYESFDNDGLKDGLGAMYLEITPITFDVRVKPDTSLSQLRIFYVKPDDAIINSDLLCTTAFLDRDHTNESLAVALGDALVGDPTGTPCTGVAFRSKNPREDWEPIPLWKDDERPDPCRYWDLEVADKFGRLYVLQESFYILRSKEKLCVPKGVAIYCRASDETMGEMRIHYAGFVHPFFGQFREDGRKGTPLIFEVRGHQVPVSLADNEKMANLIFYRMSEDPADLTVEEQNEEAKGYSSQDLKLSRFLGNWPKNSKRNEDGSIEAI